MKRILNIKNGKNFRDIGGYKTICGKTTKWNKILRSGDLINLDEKDVSVLEQRGVKHILDLRTIKENEENPGKIPAGAKVHRIPIFKDSSQNIIPKGQFFKMYDNLVFNAHAKKAYLKIFKFLIANEAEEEAILYHCLGGKDRTGIVTILLLYVLGVPEDTILKDYLLTNKASKKFNDKYTADFIKTGTTSKEIAHHNDTITAKKEYFDRAMKNMISVSTSVDKYIREEVGLSEDKMISLRKKYLE